ncbi:ATP-grasp domain-containing protein [Vreelandella populi]|uniref:ATP-grasp domain-containing protein n=1 Tax=Vreelandella populi TaxID=2498858 RepID=UPI000F8DF3FB|nr:ATP-grasp domain-containing protein [Halomonas populi]RUR56551.1 ATP-grasp domain-containing protein [Halomonas populi]
MKKIMILGAGNTVTPLIKRSSQLGYETIVISPWGDYPGFRYASQGVFCDFLDVNMILRHARMLKIDAISSTGTDIAVPVIGKIVDSLRLPGCGTKVAELCSDKWHMKCALLNAGVMTAKGKLVDNTEDLPLVAQELGYPLMCKSVDCSGSEGIFRVDGPESLSSTWEQSRYISASGRVLIEEFLNGVEFGAQAIVQGTEVIAVYFHDDQIKTSLTPLPIGHSMPCEIDSLILKKARDEVKRAIMALGVRDTIANIDLMLVDNIPYIIEVGARMGATCLPETISLYGNFDAYEANLTLALGGLVNLKKEGSGIANASRLIFSTMPGTVTSIDIPEDVSNHPQLYRLKIYCKPGDKVRSFHVGKDRIGDIIVTGDTADEARKLAETLCNKIRINVKTDLI